MLYSRHCCQIDGTDLQAVAPLNGMLTYGPTMATWTKGTVHEAVFMWPGLSKVTRSPHRPSHWGRYHFGLRHPV